MVLYSCKLCFFNTEIRQHYERHITSNKHKLNILTNNNNPKTTINQQYDNPKTTFLTKKVEPIKDKEIFLCKYCEQPFTFRQSMNRHIKMIFFMVRMNRNY